MNNHEQAARLSKAYKLADALTNGYSDIPAEAADSARLMLNAEAWWKLLADVAGTKVPSMKTRKLVVSILETRAEHAVNPFAGL